MKKIRLDPGPFVLPKPTVRMRWLGRFEESSVSLERLWELAGGGSIPIASQDDDELRT